MLPVIQHHAACPTASCSVPHSIPQRASQHHAACLTASRSVPHGITQHAPRHRAVFPTASRSVPHGIMRRAPWHHGACPTASRSMPHGITQRVSQSRSYSQEAAEQIMACRVVKHSIHACAHTTQYSYMCIYFTVGFRLGFRAFVVRVFLVCWGVVIAAAYTSYLPAPSPALSLAGSPPACTLSLKP